MRKGLDETSRCTHFPGMGCWLGVPPHCLLIFLFADIRHELFQRAALGSLQTDQILTRCLLACANILHPFEWDPRNPLLLRPMARLLHRCFGLLSPLLLHSVVLSAMANHCRLTPSLHCHWNPLPLQLPCAVARRPGDVKQAIRPGASGFYRRGAGICFFFFLFFLWGMRSMLLARVVGSSRCHARTPSLSDCWSSFSSSSPLLREIRVRAVGS